MGHSAITIQCRAIHMQTKLFPATLLTQNKETSKHAIYYLVQYVYRIKIFRIGNKDALTQLLRRRNDTPPISDGLDDKKCQVKGHKD